MKPHHIGTHTHTHTHLQKRLQLLCRPPEPPVQQVPPAQLPAVARVEGEPKRGLAQEAQVALLMVNGALRIRGILYYAQLSKIHQ